MRLCRFVFVTPFFVFFFLLSFYFTRCVLGTPPLASISTCCENTSSGMFSDDPHPPPPIGRPARLIIKCLSCQALRQHPNLFWQPVLHAGSRASRTQAHVGAHVQHTSHRRLHWCVLVGSRTVHQSGRSLGSPAVTELKVAAARWETVAPVLNWSRGLCTYVLHLSQLFYSTC